jgi:hypothetical protein
MRNTSKENDSAIHVRLSGALFKQLENWRRAQSKIPPRSDALRFLIKQALKKNSTPTVAS